MCNVSERELNCNEFCQPVRHKMISFRLMLREQRALCAKSICSGSLFTDVFLLSVMNFLRIGLVELHEKDPSRSPGAGMKFALWGLKVRFRFFGIFEP